MNPQLAQLIDRAMELPKELPYYISMHVSPEYADAIVFKRIPVEGDPTRVAFVESFYGLVSNVDELTAALAAVDSILRGDYDGEEVESLAG